MLEAVSKYKDGTTSLNLTDFNTDYITFSKPAVHLLINA